MTIREEIRGTWRRDIEASNPTLVRNPLAETKNIRGRCLESPSRDTCIMHA